MIDVFLNTNTPIKDIPRALRGFESSCVMVRNGGPTEIWQEGPSGWAKREPGLTLYDDLSHEHIELVAYTVDFGGCMSDLVGDGMPLLLTSEEASEWLQHMRRYQYQLEDAIGCSINVKSGPLCALAAFPLGEFKTMVDENASWGGKVVDWVLKAQRAGADEVGIVISHTKQ